MKKFITLSQVFALFALLATTNLQAQIHPLNFRFTNWFSNYTGVRLAVSAPNAIAGMKEFTAANDGSGIVTAWGGFVTTPLVNVPIIADSTSDSFGCAPFSISMAGKIAVIWRGSCEFSCKALAAQTAGAVACVIINNVPGAPALMGSGSCGSSVYIPVYMISYADGQMISGQYRSGALVTMDITSWGQDNSNDLGFVPRGIARWHNYAIPHNQLFAGGNPLAYKGLDGAFIANYGFNTATNVKVTDTVSFTPTGSFATVVHTGTTPTLATFTALDSIYALFNATEYNLTSAGTGNGRFDVKYTLSSDSADQYKLDNIAAYSFYTTDSLYSKGQYDFSRNLPVSQLYTGSSTTDYLWGPTYFVAHGGTAISSVQFSITANVTSRTPVDISSMNVYAFKWVDGSGGQPLDGIMENGELTPVALGVYSFSTADTFGDAFKVHMGDPSTGAVTMPIFLDSNSWYYIAAEVPAGYFLGCDGQQSTYARTFGRYHSPGILDYSDVIWYGDYNSGFNPLIANPYQGEPPTGFPQTSLITSVDSFNYNGQKGIIPAITMIVNNDPPYISGTPDVCVGGTTSLSDTKTGGTWSSSNTAIARVSTSGIVTGVAAGTATITYSSTPIAIKTVTVNVPPIAGAISGSSVICGIGAVTFLSDPVSGGTWSSSDIATVTIDSTGMLRTMALGTAVVTYTTTNICGSASAIFPVTVTTFSPTAGTITGPSTVCIGASGSLADTVSGGSWSTSNPSVLTVSSSGSVAGISAGSAVITYTVYTTCLAVTTTATITVDTTPFAGTVSGPSVVCMGKTIALTNTVTTGAWSTSNGNAFISSAGVVLGITAGVDTVIYKVTTGCGTSTATEYITIKDCTTEEINLLPSAKDVVVYPNPAKNSITVSSSSDIKELTIINLSGEKVFYGIYNDKNVVVNLSSLPDAVYLLKVNGGAIIRIVKQ